MTQNGLSSQYLFHRLTPGQLLNQLIHITDFLHEGIFNFLYPISADYAGNFAHIGIHLRRTRKKIFDSSSLLNMRFKGCQLVTGKPADNSIYLFLRTVLFLGLGNIVRIHAG